MHSLKEVIAAIRTELDAAFADNKPLSNRVILEPEKVVVNLQFRIEHQDSQPPILHFDTAKNASAPNSISIEFRYGTLPAKHASAEPSSQSAELTEVDAERVVRRLSAVFGSPSFDSSARATVFRETLADLPLEEMMSLFQPASSSMVSTDAVKRARAFLHRICQAGPAGPTEGVRMLAEVFATYDAASLLKLVAKVWKTQEDWLS